MSEDGCWIDCDEDGGGFGAKRFKKAKLERCHALFVFHRARRETTWNEDTRVRIQKKNKRKKERKKKIKPKQL